MKEYEINSSTCALIPNSNFSTTIIEKSKKLIFQNSPQEIINYSCAYYGSSFKGRLCGSKQALGSKYKLPIIVEESREMIFFPTASYENANCAWISLKQVAHYENENDGVKVFFQSGSYISLNISYESFENQILRATKLLLILKSRKRTKKH